MIVLIFLLVLFGLMTVGMPIAFAMLCAAIVMMWSQSGIDPTVVAEQFVSGSDSFALMAIPFFILTGEIMNIGGVSRRIVEFASAFVGHKRGGLGYVAIISGAIFAGLSGSAVADTAALGAILIPMMVKKGYDVNVTSGLVSSTGIVGTVFPPSIPLILYGVVGGVSITGLFIGGIVPGLLMSFGLIGVWFFINRNSAVKSDAKATASERFTSLKRSFLALMLPLIIIFGLRFGIFTPTEAGVVAAVYAALVSLVYRELSLAGLYHALVSTTKITAIVMLLVSAALVTTYSITIAQVPVQIAAWLTSITSSQTIMLLIIMAVLLLVGCVMDMTPAVLIFTPALIPVVKAIGIDPIYFGVLMIINLSIGLITPPVGTVLYVACSISRISLGAITKGIWPFLLMYIVLMFLFVLFPGIITVPLEFFYHA